MIEHTASLVITPRVGNMLGGTAVSITSTCLEESDNITCQYEGFDTVDADVGLLELDENPTVVAVCVSPAFLEPGSKTLRVVVTNKNGTLKYDIGTRFYAGIYEQNYILVAIICKLLCIIYSN